MSALEWGGGAMLEGSFIWITKETDVGGPHVSRSWMMEGLAHCLWSEAGVAGSTSLRGAMTGCICSSQLWTSVVLEEEPVASTLFRVLEGPCAS